MQFMFNNCSLLSSIDLSSFDTQIVTNMACMFYKCPSLTSLNIVNFNTKEVNYMHYMFFNCSSLSSIDLSNFNTQKVKKMQYMFSDCSLLRALNLSNFKTNIVDDISYMFYSCTSLSSLVLDNFITNNVKDMSSIFYNCLLLSSLDLSNFNTKNTEKMEYMFYNCKSFNDLNLANFEMDKITNIKYIFSGTTNLKYINLKLANIGTSVDYENAFESTPDNLILCSNFEEWKTILPGVDQNINCIDETYASSIFKCYKKNIDEQLNNKYACEICGTNFYLKENNSININSDINCCQKVEEEYYFDSDNLLFKPCYSSCKKCDKNGDNNNHNCIECKDSFIYEIDKIDYKNC